MNIVWIGFLWVIVSLCIYYIFKMLSIANRELDRRLNERLVVGPELTEINTEV